MASIPKPATPTVTKSIPKSPAGDMTSSSGAAPQPDAAATAEAPPPPGAGPVGSGEYSVNSGECVSSIARKTGHFWQTIWDDPANAEVKSIRKHPNVLLQGDRLHIPDLRKKVESGSTEQRHRFRRRGEPSHFAARVLEQDEPRANEPFELVIDEKQTITGFTDADGQIDVPIPGTARKGVLKVGKDPDILTIQVQFGQLDPITTWSGVQMRLRNLGFGCEVTKDRDEQTIDALNDFRESVEMPASDDIDEETRDKLQEAHGS